MYRAPVSEIAFTLKHVAGLGEPSAAGDGFRPNRGPRRRRARRSGPLRLRAAGAPQPRRRPRRRAARGRRRHAPPPGWREVYRDWCAGGWNGLAAPEAFGGQGLPLTLVTAATQRCGTPPAWPSRSARC